MLKPCVRIFKLFLISLAYLICVFFSVAEAIPRTIITIKGSLTQFSEQEIHKKIEQWDHDIKNPITSIHNIKARLRDEYLQKGNPNVEITLFHTPPDHLLIKINEHLEKPVIINHIEIVGGTKRLRDITHANIRQKVGTLYEHKTFQDDLYCLRYNFFIPVKLILSSEQAGQITPKLKIADISNIFPIANYTLTNIGGLGLTFGLTALNPFHQNNNFSFQTKRNNFKLLGETTPNLIQDWEYIASFTTQNTPLEQMTFGGNIFNKVDYIFDHFRGEHNVYNWISNHGFDVYSGFSLWTNAHKRQYLRGVLSLAFIQDSLYSTKPNLANELSISKNGKDNFVLPTLSLIYSDLDHYQLPQKGHFARGFLRLGSGASKFIQPSLETDSFFTPWQQEDLKLTFLIQNRAGVSFGSVPFYRGFLNAQSWFIRGATQFSIFDESSLKFTQEARLIYKFKKPLWGQKLPAFLENWHAYSNFFLDEGIYWNRQDGLNADKWQVGAGVGINLVTSGGLTLGADFTLPVYPQISTPTVFLRLSSGFFLHADGFITEGYFKR